MSYLRDKSFRIRRFVQVGTKRKPRWAWQYLTHDGWDGRIAKARIVDYETMSALLVPLRQSSTTHRIDVITGG